MSSVILVVGLSATSSRADRVREACREQGSDVVFLDDWQACRVAVFPASGRFEISAGSDPATICSESISQVIVFDRPRLPSGARANHTYQGAEFEALLFAIIFIASRPHAEHWSCALAGLSQATVDCRHGDEHPQFDGATLDTLFALGSGEAWLYDYLIAHRQPSGSVRCIATADRSQRFAVPFAVRIDADRRTVLPFMGHTPAWICDDSALLSHALTPSRGPGGDYARDISASRLTSPQAGTITILAHCRDNPGGHLLYRCRANGVPARFVDLSFALSDRCTDHDFRLWLRDIREAPFVFARPLPPPSAEADGDHTAEYRFGAILRALQSRMSTTMNRPAAGYTNLSKAAHLTLLRELGLPVAPTIATNDPDAAAAFIAMNGPVVYKSTSHARSLATMYTTEDWKRLGDLVKCPVLFQSRIDGPDYRVHTVADRVMTTRITAREADYRFAAGGASYHASSLPVAITDQLVSAARSSGLWLSGADLKISDRDGDWFVLEINRMPAFNFFDHRTTNAVADAIIDFAAGS